MDLITKTFRFYQREIPNPGDKVVFEFVKLEETLVRIKLLEYEDLPAMILLGELTRMKNVSSLQKLCPLGQTAVGEVLNTEVKDGETYIFVSTKNLPAKDKTEYLEYWHKSKRLLNFMKKINVGEKRPLVEICELVSWPLYEIAEKYLESSDILSEKGFKHPIDFIDHPDKVRGMMEPVPNSINPPQKEEQDDVFTETSGSEILPEGKDEDSNDKIDRITLAPVAIGLIQKYHEAFFGKLMSQKVMRFGLISYALEGALIIKDTLMKLREIMRTDFNEVEFTLTLRDIPVYEIKIKCIELTTLDSSHKFILEFLNSSKTTENQLLFKHISTK